MRICLHSELGTRLERLPGCRVPNHTCPTAIKSHKGCNGETLSLLNKRCFDCFLRRSPGFSAVLMPARTVGATPLLAAPLQNQTECIAPLPEPNRPFQTEPQQKDTRYPFPTATLEAALQTPPHQHPIGAYVAHLVAHREGAASEVLSELLQVPQELLLRLIWFGAVYYCPVAPLPPPGRDASLPEEQLSRIRAVRKAALAKWGNDSRHSTPRRLPTDQPVCPGGYLRVHCHPKRFPVVHTLSDGDWRGRLLEVAPDFVVVNKPAGLQVPPTVDNVQESLLTCVEQALSLPPGSLQPAHRLDAGTEGVVVLARNAAFASYFRQLMADKAQHAVRKQYLCLLPAPPPSDLVGGGRPLVHWVLEDQRAAGEMAHTQVVCEHTAGALRCELRIQQVEEVLLGEEAAALWSATTAHQATITLVTGRTHQVRVQMAALGLPLLGDHLYSALARRNAVHQQSTTDHQPPVALVPPSNETQLSSDETPPQSSPPRRQAVAWCRTALGMQLAPIALQAHSLTVLEDGLMGQAPVHYQAGRPWWL